MTARQPWRHARPLPRASENGKRARVIARRIARREPTVTPADAYLAACRVAQVVDADTHGEESADLLEMRRVVRIGQRRMGTEYAVPWLLGCPRMLAALRR